MHSWLRLQDEHLTQKFVPIWRNGAPGKYVKYKASSFLFFIFSPDSPTEDDAYWSNPWMDFDAQLLIKRRCGVHTMANNILGFKLPKTAKNDLL